jgi:D-arginine dehydrogenase
MKEYDFAVIGAGIAGTSVAYELAASHRVLLLEREPRPGYHSTGRSATLFSENYGNPLIRGLTVASRGFLERPPADFYGHPLLFARGSLRMAGAAEQDALEVFYREGRALVASLEMLEFDQVKRMCPIVRPEAAVRAVYEPFAMDLDANQLHQSFQRGLRSRGGELRVRAEVLGLERKGGLWEIATSDEPFRAHAIVNAAGAWCDEIGALAGCQRLGLTPLRRTVITFDGPPGVDVRQWPVVGDLAETYYIKAEGGRLLASPGDETPTPPSDVQPEELDIAIAADRVMTATTLELNHLHHKWAGLRSFVADRSPVADWDDAVEGFFWLAGQGGYGIMTSPALSRLAGALITGKAVPGDLAEMGVRAGELSVGRLRGPG